MKARINFYVLVYTGASQKTFKISASCKNDVESIMWAKYKISNVSIANIVEAPLEYQNDKFWGLYE
jgi:hypothetical protein